MNIHRTVRRAKIIMNARTLDSVMQLPEGMSVVRVWGHNDPMGIAVEVVGEQLGEVPDEQESPILHGTWGTRMMVDGHGELWVRWGWDLDHKTTGTELIAAERRRQVDEEGYDEEHDFAHTVQPFVSTAVEYLTGIEQRGSWPVKKTTRERDLVKAGALIAAAIDRLRYLQ